MTRAVAILRLLGRSEESLGVNAIARALRLIPSTCLHILRVLVAEELVTLDPSTKRYRLDAGILTIARSALRRNGFAETVQPELDRLSRHHGVTAGTCRTWAAPRGDLTRGSAVERLAVVDALIMEELSIYNDTIILTMTRSHGPMARPKEGNERQGAPDRLHELRGRSPSLLVGRPLGAVRR